MSELIKRKKVIELIKNSYYDLANSEDDMWAMVADVEKLPVIDAVPVRHGRWVGNERHTSCSICGQTYCVPDGQEEHLDMTFYKYCPNCGADMRGEQDEVRG